MKPVSPVFPDGKCQDREKVYAKDQPEYLPLPTVPMDDECGTVISRWKLTFKERLILLWRGDLYHSQMAFNRPLQPIMMSVEPPQVALVYEVK